MAASKWETHVKDKLPLIEGLARNGIPEEQIAKKLGVGYSTFRRYKEKYGALRAALKKGREVVDFEVEGALIKRALGYSYTEETRELKEGKDGEGAKLLLTKTVTKQVAPDITAQMFWLKNRKKEEWQNDPHKILNDKEALELRKKELDNRMW
ncbi:transposase [Clostridioides difficile]|nr:transposase [Clostridioides difficile]EGT5014195.1 transposase [Clostridioides difficile]